MSDKPHDSQVEAAKINARAMVLTAVISAFSGFTIAALAFLDRTDDTDSVLKSHPVVSDTLPSSICTTSTGQPGQVVISTNIFNSKNGSSNGFVQKHGPSNPGSYVYSNNVIGDVLDKPSQVAPSGRRWAAMWECVN